MTPAPLIMKRPDLCHACKRGESCPRANGPEAACGVRRSYFDAGYHTALSMMQSAIDYERARKLRPVAPPKRARRRRR